MAKSWEVPWPDDGISSTCTSVFLRDAGLVAVRVRPHTEKNCTLCRVVLPSSRVVVALRFGSDASKWVVRNSHPFHVRICIRIVTERKDTDASLSPLSSLVTLSEALAQPCLAARNFIQQQLEPLGLICSIH